MREANTIDLSLLIFPLTIKLLSLETNSKCDDTSNTIGIHLDKTD